MTMLLKLNSFNGWSKSEKLSDKILRKTAEEIARGLLDADLGGGLIKKRVARPGRGKRGGYRTLLAFKQNTRSIFLFGFAKNEMGNLEAAQLKELKRLAKKFLTMPDEKIHQLIATKQLIEVK